MKITKMSLVAALLVGSSAFAFDNTKVSGDAKVFYGTDDAKGANSDLGNPKTGNLFDKTNSAAQAAASLSVTSDLSKTISAGAKVTALSTLGLENQLVENVWELTNGTSDSYIVNDLWVSGTAGKTKAKFGRMELDTPLVFSEKWSLVENTYEAALIVNKDIPKTQIIGAYVGASNIASGNGYGGAIASVIPGKETTFSQFGAGTAAQNKGAYAVGVVNNSWEPLKAQAWYFDVTSQAKAYWLQADLKMDGVLLGGQFAGMDASGLNAANKSNTVYAVMAGYEMKDTFTAKVAYSAVSDDAGIGAGGNVGGTQSKLYTEAWWSYGQVTQTDTKAYNLTIEAPISDIVNLGLYATMVDHGNAKYADGDLTEVTLSASKSFGSLDTSLVYVFADKSKYKTAPDNTTTEKTVAAEQSNSIQAYLTYKFKSNDSKQ